MTRTADFDMIVIGAGVVGLAVARAASRASLSVLILDRGETFGTETSSRSSEVIHAGIYYHPTSLKARLCVAGKALLYAFCEEHGVQYRRSGKLIVAADSAGKSRLRAMRQAAESSGVDDLLLLNFRETREIEPEVSCSGALFSPSTGIIDSHGFMHALLADAEAHGAMLVCRTRVTRVVRCGEAWGIGIDGREELCVTGQMLVNASGLAACETASLIDGLRAKDIPTHYFAKGSYFRYSGKTSFRHLIYPLPDEAGLGIHLTLDLSGQARFGPDVEWIDRLDYSVNSARLDHFVKSIRRFWPNVDPNRLHPDYAGIRPKLSNSGSQEDFIVSGNEEHGLPNLVNLFGIESPGLTSSLAIACLTLRRLGIQHCCKSA